MESKVLSLEEAGRLVGLGRKAAYRAVQRGELPCCASVGGSSCPRCDWRRCSPVGARAREQQSEPGRRDVRGVRAPLVGLEHGGS